MCQATRRLGWITTWGHKDASGRNSEEVEGGGGAERRTRGDSINGDGEVGAMIENLTHRFASPDTGMQR